MEIEKLYRLVRSHYGAKATILAMNSEQLTVSCILFETFHFRCNIRDKRGVFVGGILLPGDVLMSGFFGEELSREVDEDSIRASLDVVERWCRLQLSDKFLEEYDGARLDEKLAGEVAEQRQAIAAARERREQLSQVVRTAEPGEGYAGVSG